MSVIRKKPFIESVIEDLTDEQKASLLSVMNGSGNTIDASFTNLPEADVAPVLFQLEPNNLKTGILIQAETYDVLLAYHRFQDMQIYKLDLSKFTYEKINEYLDINELRRTVTGGGGDTPSGSGSKIYDFHFVGTPLIGLDYFLSQRNVDYLLAGLSEFLETTITLEDLPTIFSDSGTSNSMRAMLLGSLYPFSITANIEGMPVLNIDNDETNEVLKLYGVVSGSITSTDINYSDMDQIDLTISTL